MATARKTLGIAGNVVFVAMLAVMLVIVGFMVKAKLDGGTPNVAGYQIMTVLSGSMEPTFMAGSMILVEPVIPEEILVGDVITFKKKDEAIGKNIVVTHRVISIEKTAEGLAFGTKGDNNGVADQDLTSAANVIGKKVLDVPYGGYLTEFAKTREGIIILIAIPAFFIILTECRKLWKYAVEYDREQECKKAMEAGGHDQIGVQ